MKNKQIRLFLIGFFCFFLFQSIIFAQAKADTLTLNPVEIRASRTQQFSIGYQTLTLDSSILSKYTFSPLANLLAEQANIPFKIYGEGSLATLAVRGTGANHTAVLWNGFNLQNTMNGVVDFNIIPVSGNAQVAFRAGGGSALSGSGAIGGMVFLENKLAFQQGFRGKIGFSAGSFDTYKQSAGLQYSTQKWASNVDFSNTNSKNNYTYLFGNDKYKLKNAQFCQHHFSQNNAFRWNNKHTIFTHFWYQNSDRNLPPSITESQQNIASQRDWAYRSAVEWQYIDNQFVIKFRTAFFDEYLLYKNRIDSSFSRIKTWTAEAETGFYHLANHQFNVGIHYTYNTANANSIGIPLFRNRFAIFASHRWNGKKMQISTNIRQEISEKKILPFTFSTGLSAQFLPHLQLHSQLSRNYNLPTFNDLYWQNLGNPNLKAEQGFSSEIGVCFSKNINSLWKFDANWTHFQLLTENWIQWTPQSDGLWRPKNLKSVWSRGLENKVVLTYRNDLFTFKMLLNYHFTRTTNEKIYDLTESISLKKQLIYVPLHQLSAQIQFFYKNFRGGISSQYNGKRFTTTDNNHIYAISAFFLPHFSLSYILKTKKFQNQFGFDAQNISNTSYQLIAYRHMPLRSFQLTWKLTCL